MHRKLSEDELDRLLGGGAALEDDDVDAALERVRFSIVAAQRARARLRPAGAPAYRRRWIMPGVAAAAVSAASLAGVTGLISAPGGSGVALAVSPAAAAQLNRVAHAAGAQPGLQAGQWKFVEITRTFTDVHGLSTVTEQDWYAADGSARERVQAAGRVTSDKLFLDPGSTSAPTPGVDENSAPSSPQALLSEISAAAPHDPQLKEASPAAIPAYFWAELLNVLVASRSPQLSATAFAALKYLPGTNVLGGQTDPLGRSGLAITFTDPNNTTNLDATHTLIVSGGTGQILENYDTLTTPAGGIPAGTVVYRAVYTQQGIVGADTGLPGGGSQPLPTSFTTSTTPDTPTTPGVSTTPDASTAAR